MVENKTGDIGTVKILVEMTISNLATWEDLRDMEFDSLLDFVRFEIDEEGLWGIVDYPATTWGDQIVSVEVIDESQNPPDGPQSP